MGAFLWNCWKKPRDRYEAGKWDAFHWRDPVPLADALRKELKASAAIRRNPLPTPSWLVTPAPLTLARLAHGLAWTRGPVYDGDGARYENCTEWLKARRAELGLADAP